jgi:hypothetical protein
MSAAAGYPQRSTVGSVVAPSDTPTSNWIELADGWRIISADQVQEQDSSVSSPGFDASHWYAARHMPATVLQILEDDGKTCTSE